MTLSEFKAWFEGFSEGIDKAPTEKQFAKIKDKVALIDGAAVTERIYLDRYVPHYPHYPLSWPVWTNSPVIGDTATVMMNGGEAVVFDSHGAMRQLGQMEAAN